MYNEKFISKEQLEELEKKADELNALIKKLKNKNRLADYCMLRPLNTPRNIKNDIPVFGFKDLECNAEYQAVKAGNAVVTAKTE